MDDLVKTNENVFILALSIILRQELPICDLINLERKKRKSGMILKIVNLVTFFHEYAIHHDIRGSFHEDWSYHINNMRMAWDNKKLFNSIHPFSHTLIMMLYNAVICLKYPEFT